MDSVGEDLFAGAGFATDQHRRVGHRDLLGMLDHADHGLAPARFHETAGVIAPHHLLAEQPILLAQLVVEATEHRRLSPVVHGHAE